MPACLDADVVQLQVLIWRFNRGESDTLFLHREKESESQDEKATGEEKNQVQLLSLGMCQGKKKRTVAKTLVEAIKKGAKNVLFYWELA